MEFDFGKTVEEIVMQAKENQEEFIFETIRPYCENVLQMKINKEELKQILLNSVQKQQSCEACISRAEAIKEFQIFREYSSNRSNSDWVDRIETVLMDLPSVTPKQKVGKWIVHPKGGYAHLVCSNCLSDAPFSCKANYCPNCGAYMAESEDAE